MLRFGGGDSSVTIWLSRGGIFLSKVNGGEELVGGQGTVCGRSD